MFFSKKKMKIYVISSQGPSGFSPKDFPQTWRIQALQPRRRWKNLTVKAPRTCCAKVWWLSTVGYPKPKPTLPGTITYHHISQPWKLGEQSSTQKWDTGDILSIPLSHPNYQLLVPTFFDLQSYDSFWYMRYMLGLSP